MKILILSLVAVIASVQVPKIAQAVNAKIESCTTQECERWFSEYKRKAREGYADAMEVLGTFYHVGYGTSIDRENALRWYKRSAKYKSVVGSYKVGMFYLTEADYVDVEQGVRYLKKAARGNHFEASYLLGMIFSQDDLIPHEYDEADKWLSKAYVTPHKQVKNYTHYLKSQNLLTDDKFPLLTELAREREQAILAVNTNKKTNSDVKGMTVNPNIEGNKIAQNHGLTNLETEFPDDEMEVIEVSSLTLVELFEADFAFFKTFMAEKRDTQARKGIYLRPCADTISCGEMSKDDFARMKSTSGAGALSGN